MCLLLFLHKWSYLNTLNILQIGKFIMLGLKSVPGSTWPNYDGAAKLE